MGAYMYPITIHEGKAIKRVVKKEIFLGSGHLTLKQFRQWIDETDTFTIDDEGLLTVYFERLETDAEHQGRLMSERKYMEEYTKRQQAKNNKL